jgi:hypothetical protein
VNEANRTYRILAINPGSTSTKIAVYDDETALLEENIRHSELDLSAFQTVWDQYEFRKRMIIETLGEHGLDLSSLVAVVGRGGLLRPVVSGTYAVNQLMIQDEFPLIWWIRPAWMSLSLWPDFPVTRRYLVAACCTPSISKPRLGWRPPIWAGSWKSST